MPDRGPMRILAVSLAIRSEAIAVHIVAPRKECAPVNVREVKSFHRRQYFRRILETLSSSLTRCKTIRLLLLPISGPNKPQSVLLPCK